MSALLNILLAFRYPATHRLTNREATFYLAYDVVQLAALLYLTGGIANPFALMFLAPVVIAAATLNLGNTLILAGLAFASVSVIAVAHAPFPWASSYLSVAAALSGRHLVVAGDRRRLHVDLCLAHLERKRAHAGRPLRHATGTRPRTPARFAGCAGDGCGA